MGGNEYLQIITSVVIKHIYSILCKPLLLCLFFWLTEINTKLLRRSIIYTYSEVVLVQLYVKNNFGNNVYYI